jgi:hypothetical protein
MASPSLERAWEWVLRIDYAVTATVQSESSSSFPCAQESCNNPRIAATVEYSDNEEGFLLRGIGNQKIAQELKTERARSEIRTGVADLREWDKGANRFRDLIDDTISSTWVIGSDIFPDFG